MQVAELLKAKGSTVATIAPDALVRDAVRELSRHNIGALVVSTDGRTIEGMLSERDVVRQLEAIGTDVLASTVRSIMSELVQTCDPGDSVESLTSVMTTHRIRHVPVVEDSVLVGLVSIGDVVKVRMDELESDRAALMNYITAR